MRNSKRIRKVILGVLVFVLTAMMITACGSTANKPEKEEADTIPEEAPQEAEVSEESEQPEESGDEIFRLGETAIFDNLKMTALEIKESQGDDFVKPDDGKIFVGIKFRIENISDEDETISSILLFNGYVDEVKVDAEWMSPDDLSDGTLDGTLAAGKIMEGYYILQAGTDWSEVQLDVQSSWLSNTKAEFVINK